MYTQAALLVLVGCVYVSTYAQLVPNLGGQRAGISAFQFLKIGVGARGVAMGESFVAVANDASAMYWNPAGLVQFTDNAVLASHTEYVVDIRHAFFGVVYHLTSDDAVAASIASLYMDDMEITTETQPFGTGRYFTFSDIALGMTYAKRMTEQFSFGVTVRYVEETLDILKMRSVMVDLGTYYWTGLGTTRFAVVITNFGADVEPTGVITGSDGNRVTEFQKFSLPTVFKLGVAFDPIAGEDQKLTTSLQLNHPNDNAEHIRMGLEYSWRNAFFVRAGIKRTIGQPLFAADGTSEEDIALGAGILAEFSFTTVSVDYAFVNFNRLGSVHRIALAFTF